MNLTALIPAPYRILALIAFAVALMGFGWVKGAHHVQAEWDTANAAHLAADNKAILARVASNTKLAEQQAATNKAITTRGSPLNLGDIDAVWVVYDTTAPGDNFLVFDDYQVTGVVPAPRLQMMGWVGQAPTVRLFGQSNTTFAVEASTNLVNWTAIKTNVVTGTYFDYVDNGAVGLRRRFYRGRWVP